MIDIGVPLMSDGLVLEINRQTLAEPITFIGIRGDIPIAEHFPNGKTTGVSHPGMVWEMFHEQQDKFPRIPNGRNVGVAYHDADVTPAGCFSYFVGTERKTVDSECHTWTLPAAEYLVCRFEAETFDELQSVAMNKAFNYIRMWQDNKGLKHGNFGAEIYYETVASDGFAYMEIWALWLE
jgi:AraC family transcriptional regulator